MKKDSNEKALDEIIIADSNTTTNRFVQEKFFRKTNPIFSNFHSEFYTYTPQGITKIDRGKPRS